jgi:hypothetical protein
MNGVRSAMLVIPALTFVSIYFGCLWMAYLALFRQLSWGNIGSFGSWCSRLLSSPTPADLEDSVSDAILYR